MHVGWVTLLVLLMLQPLRGTVATRGYPQNFYRPRHQRPRGAGTLGAEQLLSSSTNLTIPQLSQVTAAPAPARSDLAYVLLGSGTRDDLLVRVLTQLRKQLLPWTPGDVLLFHTGEYNTAVKQQLVTDIIPNARLLQIPHLAWQLPAGLSEAEAPHWKYAPCCPYPMHGVGYRHMCRWYSNAMFQYLHQLGYSWVIRLDEDSEVLSEVQHNMVEWMEANKKQYGFRLWDEDDPEVIWSLPEITAWYITANNIKPAWLYESCRPRSSVGLNSWGGWNRKVIYNNMFMANITWWLSKPVQSYLHALEQTHGFYLFRWGDAPVHTMVVRMFLHRDQVHRFGFSYCHKGNCDHQRLYHGMAFHAPGP